MAVKKTNLPINPTELLKKQLANANERVGQSEARRIKVDKAGFTAPDNSIGKELEVVIIDFSIVHSFFSGAYDADNISLPDCYANNRIFMELAPVEDSPTPQSETCGTCEKNKYKSAANGKGKACRNYRLMALVPANKIKDAPMWTFQAAPTSTRNWDDYVKTLMQQNLTPMFVKTKITFKPVGTYAVTFYELMETLNKTEIADVIARLEEARDLVDTLPNWPDE